ncbi:MAG: hypothetical protein IKN44_07230 [Bacteroidaceae bacterium]|nr:hypothetical protein [Bacteroidaceae bacterium]
MTGVCAEEGDNSSQISAVYSNYFVRSSTPYSDDLEQFNADYLTLTQEASTTCQSTFREDAMISCNDVFRPFSFYIEVIE